MESKNYVLLRLEAALRALALGDGTLTERLAGAATAMRLPDEDVDLPPELASRYEVLRQHLVGPGEASGMSSETYLRKLATPKAREYAMELLDFVDALRLYLQDEQ